MERMDEYRMARMMLVADTGQTEFRVDRWCEGGLGQQRDDCLVCAKDRMDWRALVHMYMIEFHAVFFFSWFL